MSRRADRFAPNESSVSQMRAELWAETCFHLHGALVERTARSRRADRDAPNESSVAQMGADLWSKTCFRAYGALVERTGRFRRADRDAPNESSVAQLGAELWPETCFGRMCIQKIKAASMFFFGALDDHPCVHYRPGKVEVPPGEVPDSVSWNLPGRVSSRFETRFSGRCLY